MGGLGWVQLLSVLLLPVLLAITMHEAAHAWAAKRLGDNTAARLGRVSINPLRHVDMVGTLVVPLLTYLLTGFLFGWAKPVPISWNKLGHPRRDVALVALAGPASNGVMALCWSLLLLAALSFWQDWAWAAQPLALMAAAGVFFNSLLMVLNLMPLLPLDGGRILNALLPARLSGWYMRIEPFGLLIVVVLLATGLLAKLMWPLITAFIQILPASGAVIELFFT